MLHPITIPRLGWNMEHGAFVEWLKSDGDAVKVDPAQVQQFVRTAISTPAVQASGDDTAGGVKPVAATTTGTPSSDTKQPATSTAAGCVN